MRMANKKILCLLREYASLWILWHPSGHNTWKRRRRQACSVSGHVFFLDVFKKKIIIWLGIYLEPAVIYRNIHLDPAFKEDHMMCFIMFNHYFLEQLNISVVLPVLWYTYMPKMCPIFLFWNDIAIIIIMTMMIFHEAIFGAPSELGALCTARDARDGSGSAGGFSIKMFIVLSQITLSTGLNPECKNVNDKMHFYSLINWWRQRGGDEFCFRSTLTHRRKALCQGDELTCHRIRGGNCLHQGQLSSSIWSILSQYFKVRKHFQCWAKSSSVSVWFQEFPRILISHSFLPHFFWITPILELNFHLNYKPVKFCKCILNRWDAIVMIKSVPRPGILHLILRHQVSTGKPQKVKTKAVEAGEKDKYAGLQLLSIL